MDGSLKGFIGAALIVAGLGLGACADGGEYTSFSASSYDDYRPGPRGDRDWDGIPNRFDRDLDGDGIPNQFDSRPNNPRWR